MHTSIQRSKEEMYPSRPQINFELCQIFKSRGTITVKEAYRCIKDKFSMTTEEAARRDSQGACLIEHEIRWEMQTLQKQGRITGTGRKGEWRLIRRHESQLMKDKTSYKSNNEHFRADTTPARNPVPENAFYRLTVHLVGGTAIMRDYYDFVEAHRDARDLTDPLDRGSVKDWYNDCDNEAFIVTSEIAAVCIERLPSCNDLPPFLDRIHCERAVNLVKG